MRICTRTPITVVRGSRREATDLHGRCKSSARGLRGLRVPLQGEWRGVKGIRPWNGSFRGRGGSRRLGPAAAGCVGCGGDPSKALGATCSLARGVRGTTEARWGAAGQVAAGNRARRMKAGAGRTGGAGRQSRELSSAARSGGTAGYSPRPGSGGPLQRRASSAPPPISD